MYRFNQQLVKAARHADLEEIRKLICNDGLANFKSASYRGRTVLHLIAEKGPLDMVEYLVDTKKADFNIKDDDGRTPLHFAASNGRLEIVQYLIGKKKADFTVKSNFGKTPLYEAIFAGWFDVAKYLINEEAGVNIKIPEGKTALDVLMDIATEMGFTSMTKLFRNQELVDTAGQGDLNKVKELIDNGADLNTVDNYGMTPLHYAALNGKLNIVKYLIECLGKANPSKLNKFISAKAKNGMTPLHYAATSGNLNIIEYLIECLEKVNPSKLNKFINARAKNGMTPFHCATENGELNVVKCLVKKGVNDKRVVMHNLKLPIMFFTGRSRQLKALHDKLQRIVQLLLLLVLGG